MLSWTSKTTRRPRELTQYQLKTWFSIAGQYLLGALAVVATFYSVVSALLPELIKQLSWAMGIVLAVCLIVIIVISSSRTIGLRMRTYRTDPSHGLTIRVDDFQGSMSDYPNANIAFGAHDTFDPRILHEESLHAIIYDSFLEFEAEDADDRETAKVEAHGLAVESSAGPIPESGHYPYGTVAVLPILKEPLGGSRAEVVKSNRAIGCYQRRAYLIVNSTWGTNTFSSCGDVRAVTNPLRRIIEKHREDCDTSATLLVALIGTGKSSSVSSMASMLTLIDEFFHQRELMRQSAYEFDPVSHVVVSLRPNELQSGSINLEVVHQYCAAKLKAFRSK